MAASAAVEFDEWLKTTGLTAKIRKQAARIRELERENESLQKTADAQQKTIEIKSWTIKDLEQDNAELQKKVTKCLRNERAARGIIERLTKDFAKTFESSDFTPEATKKFFLGAMLEFEVADELFSAEDV